MYESGTRCHRKVQVYLHGLGLLMSLASPHYERSVNCFVSQAYATMISCDASYCKGGQIGALHITENESPLTEQ